MATYIRKLKDASGNTILPATRVNGVFAADNTRLDTYLSDMESSLNSKIEAAKTDFASANATASQVLEGRTFYAQNKTLKTGTMPSRITVGKNGVVGISSVHPNVPVSRGSNCQLNVNTSGEEWLSIGVPEGYYNGVSSSYVGVPTSHAKSALDWPTERGQYQYAGGIGSGTDENGRFYALNNIPEGIYRKNGADWAPEIRISEETYLDYVPGGNRGAWTGLVNPGSSITIPAGYHNGSGKVTARYAGPIITPVDRTVGWGSGVLFNGYDTNSGSSNHMRICLKYWCRTEYNVNGYICIMRNGQEVHATVFNKNYGSPYNDDNPNGFIDRTFSESGTYSIQIKVDYQAGNGEIKFGGALIGY